MTAQGQYSVISPEKQDDVGKCYYCRSVMVASDYAPPVSYASDDASITPLLKIPSCDECLNALKKCSFFDIDERQNIAKEHIAKKYCEALNIYLKWHEPELDEMGKPLTESILAGIRLGDEADTRLSFKGFRYTTESGEASLHQDEEDEFWAFEECFPTFRAAFQYT